MSFYEDTMKDLLTLQPQNQHNHHLQILLHHLLKCPIFLPEKSLILCEKIVFFLQTVAEPRKGIFLGGGGGSPDCPTSLKVDS